MEEIPELVALFGIVAGDGPHVREFIAQGYYLGVARGTGKTVDGCLLTGSPLFYAVPALMGLIALRSDKRGHTVTELGTYLLYGDVGVLYGVVQGSGGQQFLVVCHRGYDFHGLQGVYDIRKSLAATLCPGMGADGEHDGAVQQFGV
jgi:hypothetical protein